MIHNPDAGDDQQPSGDELLGLIRGAGHTTAYQSSKEADWDKALKEPGDLVAVAGGDGIVGQGCQETHRETRSYRRPAAGNRQ